MKSVKWHIAVRRIVTALSHKRLQSFVARLSAQHAPPLAHTPPYGHVATFTPTRPRRPRTPSGTLIPARLSCTASPARAFLHSVSRTSSSLPSRSQLPRPVDPCRPVISPPLAADPRAWPRFLVLLGSRKTPVTGDPSLSPLSGVGTSDARVTEVRLRFHGRPHRAHLPPPSRRVTLPGWPARPVLSWAGSAVPRARTARCWPR